MTFFGHHYHATPTFAERAGDAGIAILHLPLAFWLTIIPIAGGLAIAYVSHRLTISRDRLTVRREDERRRVDEARIATRVRADLTFRLSRHREALRAAMNGNLSGLSSEHETLVRRCAEADVIDLLGKRYPAFMVLLQREETIVSTLRSGELDSGAVVQSRRSLEELDKAFDTYIEDLKFTDGSLVAKSSV